MKNSLTDLIVSHRHKFIFFAVPKTATHSVREALRAHMGPDDWEQQVLYGKQSLPIPQLAALSHGHITAQELKPHLDPAVWEEYFKFGFVRNPFDRFISTCFFLNRNDPRFSQDAVATMKDRLGRKRFQQRVLVRPQCQQLCDADGRLALDYVGRYEDLQACYDSACDQIGIPGVELDSKNESRHASYQDYYDEELHGLVAEFYADDLRIFGYDNTLQGQSD